MIAEEKLDAEIKRLLDVVYAKRFNKLKEIQLKRLLKKNPYLFRSIGINDANDLIVATLDAFLSSSDETLFGNEFFEPLALWTAQNANHESLGERTVTVGSASGTDLSIETTTSYLAIAVKSGTNIFNSQSTKGQSTEFKELQARLRKMGKEIRPIIGHGYGRTQARVNSKAEKHAGEAFWHLLSGEQNFYLRICDSIGKFALLHRTEYLKEYSKTKNRLNKQLSLNFVSNDGELDWQKLVTYNSSVNKAFKLEEASAEES